MGLIDDQGRRPPPPRRVNRPNWADYRRHFADTNPEETRADAQLVWGHQTGNVVPGRLRCDSATMAREKAAAGRFLATPQLVSNPTVLQMLLIVRLTGTPGRA